MDRKPHLDAFKRILEVADRNHLCVPFQRNSKLRARYFPGSGPHIARTKLLEAYAREFLERAPDEKLLQHGVAPWINGYDASLAHLLDDLKNHSEAPPPELPAERMRILEKQFTRVGAEEIAAFWTIYAAGDAAYRKGVIDALADVTPAQIPTAPPILRPVAPPPPQIEKKEGIDPVAQATYALIGALAFFVPSLLIVGIQYWRQPDESHWIAVSIAALFGLITLAILIDFLRKRKS